MAMQPDRQIADMGGTSSLPRKNGELVFDAAWEARVFGMTISMHEKHLFDWNEFRDELIECIAVAGSQHELSPLACGHACGHQANAARSPGNHNHLLGERLVSPHHCSIPLFACEARGRASLRRHDRP